MGGESEDSRPRLFRDSENFAWKASELVKYTATETKCRNPAKRKKDF